MEIRSPTEYARFLSSHELMRLDSIFVQLIHCINNYAAACSCEKREDKAKLYENCTKLYNHAVLRVSPRLKNEILGKANAVHISFYSEAGQLIMTLSR